MVGVSLRGGKPMSQEYAEYRHAWQRRWCEAEKQDQKRAEKLRETALTCARLLVERFDARRVYLFGSLARGHRLHSGSDIDLAVEGLGPGRVYWRALSQLWELLPPGAELDLVPMEDAHPELIDLIHREGELLYAAQELHRPTGRCSAGTEESGPPD
jgi:predicted nucleotidyltransferase